MTRSERASSDRDPAGLGEVVKRLALAVGFDRAGVAPAAPTRETRFFREWLARGLGGAADGPLAYLARRADERVDPTRLLEGARSVVAVALAYDADPSDRGEEPGARIARYARGDDYHEVMLDRLRALASALEALTGGPVRNRVYVDTGPVLERVFAARAGLGWLAKNTLLIDPSLGSYLFLGVLLTELELAADTPESDHCGSCRACLDACPTDAFPEPYVLDATRCIAYTTIEDPGPIPIGLRAAHGENLFGCDICQEVCPWNRRGGRVTPADPLGLRARLAPRSEWLAPSLAWVLDLDEDAWLAATKHSAIRRAKRRGLLRNALVVAGNSGDRSLRASVARHAEGADALLAEHARWALERLDARS